MVRLRNIIESNFKKEFVDVDDEHYDLVNKIHQQFGNNGPILIDDNTNTLKFCVNLSKNRIDSEIGKNLYVVKIEKVKIYESKGL